MKRTMMVPRAKEERFFDTKSSLSSNVEFTADNYTDKIGKLFELFIPEIKWTNSKNGTIDIKHSDSIIKEGYTLTVKNNKVEITYSDYLGIRNAIASLTNLIKNDFTVCECEIYDYPKSSHRGLMIDLGRGVEKFEKIKEDLILAAKSKMNIFHFHFYDDIGCGLQLKSLPESCILKDAYSYEQISQLVELCDVLALEIIPEFDLPAHASTLLKVIDEMVCVTGKEILSKWCACAGSEKTYEVYESVIDEITRLFPGKYLHIGNDEISWDDIPRRNMFCEWEICSRCREYMKKNNIADRRDLYYHLITRVYDMAKKRGRTLIIWSDQIDTNREVKLPRDIIFQFWRVAAEGRGPHENCSMNHQLKLGYKVVNSVAGNTYVHMDGYMSSENIKDWCWDKEPYSDDEFKENILGSELCIWEYPEYRMPHYPYVLPSAIVLMGDKLWNKDSLPYSDEYGEAMTKTIIGFKTPDKFNVFKAIGDVLPPRNHLRIYKKNVTISDEEIGKILDTLDSLRGNTRADIYKECIEEGLKIYQNWENAKSKFNVGDEITVKVARIFSSCVAAEIIPGVNGFILLSEIPEGEDGKPLYKFQVGQEIDVKIAQANWDAMNVILSVQTSLSAEK